VLSQDTTEQWILTLITSVIGGLICGFAAQPRRQGQIFCLAMGFNLLCGASCLLLGIAPDHTDFGMASLVRNIAGFFIGALVAYLSPVLNRSSASET